MWLVEIIHMPVKIDMEIKYLSRPFCKDCIYSISLRVIKHTVEFDTYC